MPDGIVGYFLIRKVREGLAQQELALIQESGKFHGGNVVFHCRKKNDSKDNIPLVNNPSRISEKTNSWDSVAILAT